MSLFRAEEPLFDPPKPAAASSWSASHSESDFHHQINTHPSSYPFLYENENEKLKTCLLNFLSVHQYELARALMIEYFNNISQSDALFLLNHCIDNLKHPKNYVTSRFKWFCYCVYTELLQSKSCTITDHKKYSTEILSFETLLDCCVNTFKLSEKFSADIVSQMKNIYAFRFLSRRKQMKDQNYISTLSLHYSTNPVTQQIEDSILDLLSEMYDKCPHLASYLEKDVLECVNNRYILIEKINQLLNNEEFEKAAYLLRFMPSNWCEDVTISKMLKTILTTLIAKKNLQLSSRSELMLVDLIYESLIFSDTTLNSSSLECKMLKYFCQIEEEILSGQEGAVSKPVNNQTFWINYIEFVRVTNSHVFESRLTKALDLIRSKQFDDLAALLNHDNFSRLRPLVLLLSWDELKCDVHNLKLVIDKLWTTQPVTGSFTHDPWIEFTCNELAYFIDFSTNASELILEANRSMSSSEKKQAKELVKISKFKKMTDIDFKGSDKKDIANLVIEYIPKHSVLYLLMPWIPAIRENDLIELVRNRPTLSDSEESEKVIDVILIRAYFAVRETLLLVRNKTPSVVNSLKSLENSILNIPKLEYRLSVLETVFQILFTKNSDTLKQATSIYTSEQRHIVSPTILGSLLTFLKQRVVEITNEKFDTSLEYRLQRFQNILDEGLWRFNLVKLFVTDIEKASNVSQSHFVQLWTASPSVLFIVAMKKNLFGQAKDIISRFGLGLEYQTKVTNAELMHAIHTEHDKEIHVQQIIEQLPNFVILFDLLFALRTESKECYQSLIKKLRILERRRTPLLDMLNEYLEFPYQGPIYRVFSKIFNYNNEKNLEKLKQNIELERTKSYSLKALCLAENKRTLENIDIANLIENLKNRNERYSYISYVLAKILESHKILSATDDNDPLGTFSLLRKGLSRVLSELVFENEDYVTAQKLSEENRIHLLGFILESANMNKQKQTISISLNLAKFISSKSEIVGSLSALYFTDFSTANQDVLELISGNCKRYDILNRWIEKKIEPIKDAFIFSKQVDIRKALKKFNATAIGPENDDSLYLTIIQNLIEIDDYDHALQLAEKGLANFTPDFLLKLYIECQNDHRTCHSLISKIKDKELAFSLIEVYMEEWDIDVCIELIKMCTSYFINDKTKLKLYEKSSRILERLYIFKQVMSSELKENYESWVEMKEVCDNNPYRFISDLITECEFDLARRAAKNLLEGVSQNSSNSGGETYESVTIHIEQEYCLYMLQVNTITDKIRTKVMQALSRLSPENALSVCKHVLLRLDIYENKMFVCEFILSSFKELLTPEQIHSYEATLIGMKVIRLLDDENKKKLGHLLLKPTLIIENLIILNEIGRVAKILSEIPELREDRLLVEYGLKALSLKNFDLVFQEEAKKKTSRTFSSDNEEHNAAIRKYFTFPQAPSILLAKSILDICKDYKLAGDSILSLCDEISKSQHLSRTNRISLVGQIVRYAKICFSKDAESHERLGLCDTILSHVEILKQIIYQNCNIGSISLSDLSQQNRARQIRDTLIQLDHLNLALNVATRCQIESDPVWTQWGITLLTLGKYKQAREKLKYCQTLTPQQKQQLLNRILAILEGTPSVVAIDQKMSDKLKEAAMESLATSNSPSKKKKNDEPTNQDKHDPQSSLHTHLDEERMREAQYYIKHFGSSDVYLSFLVRNGKIDAAVLYLFKKQMPQGLFVDVIVQYCVKHGLMSFLQNVIRQYDNTLNKCYPYLTATCKFLNQNQSLNLLYDFQVFMDDNIRAGLTKIRLFLKSEDQTTQLAHLDGAKKHFIQGLQNISSHDSNDIQQKQVLKPDEISRYIKTINLQMEVTKKFGNIVSPTTNTRLSLFDSAKGKCEITEYLMTQSFDLSFRIASEYHLPIVKLYIRILCGLVRKKQIPMIENLLKQIRGTPISDEDWDVIINNIIKLCIKEMNDEKNAEKFIAKLRNDSKKVRACLLCNRFKAAYLIAVKCNNLDDVKLIYDYCSQVADSKATSTIAEHCLKYLKDHGIVITPSTPTNNESTQTIKK
ncbi:hypothetical protein FDP41_010912 [Naegleria fowleri]|uniref:ZFYVE26-like TPR repeats domain-containing protein n=1 Tax=Naegleria fowleri TaxID=5763 RepID=A0A6A5BXV7_NAEFO|nr:uncharacterized protein FDP41_010912 [Naegleria fowleri]KAF0982933.1 hypothetical protein FDP41_010912 [Naegleria fowleri]